MSRLDELIQELCPDEVEYKTIQEVCVNICSGGTPKTSISEYYGGDIPWVRTQEVDWNYIYDTDVKITEEGLANSSAKWIPANCIIVAMYGATAAKVTINKIPVTTNQACCNLEINENIVLIRYVYHFLCNEYENLKGMGQGSQSNINAQMIKNYRLPVPPLKVQREIVRILDSFTLLTAELTAELTARKKQYEYYRDELLNNNQNVNARVGKLIDMLSQPITDGPHTTPVLVDDGIPFLSAEAVSDGKIHFDKKRGNISKEFDEECCKKYKPQRNDVFMVKSGSTTGKVGYVDTDERFNIWSPIAALRVNDNNSSRYLFHLLQSTSVQNMVKSKASHGSQPNLGMRVLEQFEVTMPPLDVQIKIAEVLDNFDAICSDLNIGLPAEIEARQKQYEFYRDKLLSFKQL